MLRLGRGLRTVQQRHERFLDHVLRLAVAQPQRAPVENQLCRFRLVKPLAPTWFTLTVHISSMDRHRPCLICISYLLPAVTT